MLSLLMKNSFALYGNIGIITFEPSNGGSGIKLNIPSPILIEIVVRIMLIIIEPALDIIKVIPANLYIAQ